MATSTPPQAAVEFLLALDPHADRFVFQTFTDAANRPTPDALAGVRVGTLEEHHPWLQRMNDRGAGVAIQINEGVGRGAKHITSVRAVFVDLDGGALPDEWPLEPSMIVETSPGRYHLYWFVSDLPLTEFRRAQLHLAEALDGDPSVNNLDRVMRLPGYLHQKHGPVLSRLVL